MGKAEAQTIGYTKNPNWLLRGLVLLSIGVHAWALGHMAGLNKREPVSYIELEMRSEEKPSGRDIPLPPQRQKTKPQLAAQAFKPLCPIPVVKPATPPATPRSLAARPSVVEPITVPETPNASTPAALDWQPSSMGGSTETASAASSSAYGSSADYFGMVRMMIENHKRYPSAARRRQIQGRAVVRFVISADGSATDVALVEPSAHRMLDEAALAAVKAAGPFPRPPRHLFSGPIPLEISIVFELM
ncbi:energy transducer TonB [Desulfosarcina sp.]|uniref:energy transducer TonB n=1 Tax=Desulfosarcina sp. TaxID=2027861 RepID=UPI00397100D7